MQWNEFRSHIGHLGPRQQQRVKEAFDLGEKMHSGQKRMSDEPYFTHPIAVANMLADMGADPDTIIAALLHDTIEDTTLTLREIENAFGGNVGMLIEGVTKLSAADVAGLPNLNEQIETLRKMFRLMERDIRIMVIKLVDRLHNMQTVGFLSAEKQRALAQETIDIYVKIADRLCMQDLRDELEGLCLAALNPASFPKLQSLRTQNEIHAETVIAAMRRRIQTIPEGWSDEVDIVFGPKTWDNLREQLESEGTLVTGISTVTAIFICHDLDCCYRTLGILHRLWKREGMSFQDFINTPAINGYRGLHTTVILEDGTRVRCKICTEEMHEYARHGITLHCFTGKFSGLFHLPWTERISSIAQDTEGQSDEFWETLQSDILGDSIVIYGPGDQSVTVPKDSTALDGAFYLCREASLNTTSISIAGKEVPFATPLQHAVSLNVTVGPERTANRSWIDWTKTGFATAMIRQAISAGKNTTEKILIGKELLQRALSQEHKGFIEEFGERSVREGLEILGYPSLESVYVAIADGRMEPIEAFQAIFEHRRKSRDADQRPFRLSYTIDTAGTENMDRIGAIHRKYREGLTDIGYHRHPDPRHGRVTLRGKLSADEQRSLKSEITAVSGKFINTNPLPSRMIAFGGVLILVMLWGLDPVFARLLLVSGIPPLELTIMRFLTVWIIAAAIYAGQFLLSRQRLKGLNPLNPDLLLSGILLFVTGLATYLALMHIHPTQYILFIIGGVLINNLRHYRVTWQTLLSLMVVFAVLIVLSVEQGWSIMGFFTAFLSSAGFALYSIISKRYQEEKAFVRTRYPAFLFWMATSGLLLSSLLIPFSNFSTLPLPVIFKAVMFSAIFIVLPYLLYFEYMRRMNSNVLNQLLPFVCLATIFGEAVTTWSLIPFIGLALPLLFIAFLSRSVLKSLHEI